MIRNPVPFAFACAALLTLSTPAFAITDAEADAIIAAEFDAENDRRAEQQARLLENPAIRETVHSDSDSIIVVRQVAPPGRIPDVNSVEKEEPTRVQESAMESPSPEDIAKTEVNFTLFVSATSEGSVIRVPAPDGETEYTVFSRLITHLPAFFTVETADIRYHFFAIVTPAGAIADAPKGASDYQIYSGSAPASKSFESAMIALHEHYREHQAEWKAEAERARALEAARERHRAQNPPEPRVTILNVWDSQPAPADTPETSDR